MSSPGVPLKRCFRAAILFAPRFDGVYYGDLVDVAAESVVYGFGCAKVSMLGAHLFVVGAIIYWAYLDGWRRGFDLFIVVDAGHGVTLHEMSVSASLFQSLRQRSAFSVSTLPSFKIFTAYSTLKVGLSLH